MSVSDLKREPVGCDGGLPRAIRRRSSYDTMSDALAWALAYAAHGLLLLPVKADKTPLTPHGLRDASGDPAVIEGWERRWPFADWGWALAAAVVAIDIDVKPGRNGYQDFRRLPRVRSTRRYDAVGVDACRRDAPPSMRRGSPTVTGWRSRGDCHRRLALRAATSYCLVTRTAVGGSTSCGRRPWLPPRRGSTSR